MRTATERRLRRDVARRVGCDRGGSALTFCPYCGDSIAVDWRGDVPVFRAVSWDDDGVPVEGDPAHLDHIIPECRNGPTSLDNTVVACAPCNMAKGDSALGDPGFLDWIGQRRMAKAQWYAERQR